MLVNNKKSGHPDQGCDKDVHIKVLSHTANPKNQHFATTTFKFGLAKCSGTISNVCSHPTGPRHLAPTQQRQGDRNQEPAPPTRTAYLRPKSLSTTVYHTETKQWSGHSLIVLAKPRTLLQSILQTAGAERRGPGFVSTSRNRSLRQP